MYAKLNSIKNTSHLLDLDNGVLLIKLIDSDLIDTASLPENEFLPCYQVSDHSDFFLCFKVSFAAGKIKALSALVPQEIKNDIISAFNSI